jgi:NAD(P)H-hydrate epimerase
MTRDAFGFAETCGWPAIDAAGMTEVDQVMIDTYGISLPQMMENAGRALAVLARDRFFGGAVAGRQIVVLAGAGGGVLTAARRLAVWGAQVRIVLAKEPAAMTPVPGQQLAILRAMGLRPALETGATPDLILDGLIGYSLRGAPVRRTADLIYWANSYPAPVLSLDVPSGFDAQTGTLRAPWIRADATLTLALPKCGMAQASEAVGDLYLADISVPPGLYEQLEHPLVVPGFGADDILRLCD